MIRVVTLEREYGSGGGEIAAQLAARLGWPLWDEALTRMIAERTHTDIAKVAAREERRDPLFYRFFKGFLYGSFEGNFTVPRIDLLDAEKIVTVTSELVRSIANQNAVVVGRGSAYFLQDRPDVLHVFIYAPPEEKIRRLIATGMDAAEAQRRVETVDRDRAAFIREFFGKEWPNRSLYHLMVNSTVGEEAVIHLIRCAITHLPSHAPAPA